MDVHSRELDKVLKSRRPFPMAEEAQTIKDRLDANGGDVEDTNFKWKTIMRVLAKWESWI